MTNVNDMNENLARSIGIYVRAFPSSYEILTDSIGVALSLLRSGRTDVDATGVVTLEVFPNHQFNRFDNIQVMVLHIVREFMVVGLTDGWENAYASYTLAVHNAVGSYSANTRNISVKAINSYIEANCRDYNNAYPASFDIRSTNLNEALLINQYLSESLEHFQLG